MEVSKSVLTSFCCTGTLGIALFSTALAKTYQLIWQAILEYFPVFNGKQLLLSLFTSHCFPGGSADKESACNARDLGSIPGLGRTPGEGIRLQRVRHNSKTFTFFQSTLKCGKPEFAFTIKTKYGAQNSGGITKTFAPGDIKFLHNYLQS